MWPLSAPLQQRQADMVANCPCSWCTATSEPLTGVLDEQADHGVGVHVGSGAAVLQVALQQRGSS